MMRASFAYNFRSCAPGLHSRAAEVGLPRSINYSLSAKILETNGFAQAVCGEFIRISKVQNHRRCSLACL